MMDGIQGFIMMVVPLDSLTAVLLDPWVVVPQDVLVTPGGGPLHPPGSPYIGHPDGFGPPLSSRTSWTPGHSFMKPKMFVLDQA